MKGHRNVPYLHIQTKEKTMTDQLDGSAAGNANLSGQESGNSGVNSESETVQQLLKRIETLEAHQKTQQSGKDRGINQLEQKVDGQFAEISKYLAENADPAVAERNYLLDKMLEQYAGEANVGAGVGSGTNALAGQEVSGGESANLLKGLGVDNQSAEFKQAIAAGATPEQAALQILAERQANAAGEEGTASGIAGGGSGTSLSGDAQVALEQARLKELDAQPHWTPYALQQLNDKYIKLGMTGIQ
jgi:hypothetical protein